MFIELKKNSLEKVKNLLKCHITTVIKFIQLHAVLLYQYPYDTNEKTVRYKKLSSNRTPKLCKTYA